MAVSPSERLLLLWDIDHTLMETRGVGTQLYRQAFEKVTGHRVTHTIELAGRTELAILADTLERHGIVAGDDIQARYGEELARQYSQNADLLRERGRALPGAVETLAAFADASGVVQTVLTGNLQAVAITKLQVFGLAEHIDLEVGAYGEEDSERARLVAIAQRRASTSYGTRFDRSNTVIIGDTTQDVVAAHHGGAAIVAVASGRDSSEDLRKAGAGRVLPDLTSVARTVSAVMDATR